MRELPHGDARAPNPQCLQRLPTVKWWTSPRMTHCNCGRGGHMVTWTTPVVSNRWLSTKFQWVHWCIPMQFVAQSHMLSACLHHMHMHRWAWHHRLCVCPAAFVQSCCTFVLMWHHKCYIKSKSTHMWKRHVYIVQCNRYVQRGDMLGSTCVWEMITHHTCCDGY